MTDHLDTLLEQWLDEPIKNLNLLNKLVPQLMTQFSESGDKKESLKKIIGIVESIRETLDEMGILKGAQYVTILSQTEAKSQEGASSANDKAKAANFISQRLSVLLQHFCANCSKKNVKEVIRLLMPFV